MPEHMTAVGWLERLRLGRSNGIGRQIIVVGAPGARETR